MLVEVAVYMPPIDVNRKFVAQRIGKPIIEIYVGIERLGSYIV